MRPLTDDEFRLLAYLRGCADRCDQHFDPGWVAEQLGFSAEHMRAAARGLAGQGLASAFEWSPRKVDLLFHPEIGDGPFMTDIRLTDHGWNYFRRQEV